MKIKSEETVHHLVKSATKNVSKQSKGEHLFYSCFNKCGDDKSDSINESC